MSMQALFIIHVCFSDRFKAITILCSNKALPLEIISDQFTNMDIKADRWASEPEGPLLFGFYITAVNTPAAWQTSADQFLENQFYC